MSREVGLKEDGEKKGFGDLEGPNGHIQLELVMGQSPGVLGWPPAFAQRRGKCQRGRTIVILVRSRGVLYPT
jgi:hypothetical protein